MRRRLARIGVVSAARGEDHRLLARWMRPRPRPVDEALVALSRAANRSVLWLVIGSAVALTGGQRGRRAALTGAVAIGLASGIVNGPLKLSVRRPRPTRSRRTGLPRMPRSSSFPSGHSASAFAFATAVTVELPVAGAALLPLAAAVAYSRVYLGVHYPSDVVIGSALGVVAGVAAAPGVRRLIPDWPSSSAASPRASLPREAVLVFSPHAGRSAGLGRARAALENLGIRIVTELEVDQVDQLFDLVSAADGPSRLVIAAGGDGTVGAVADRIANSDNVLVVLPLGTSNDFARSLGIPIHPGRAAKLIAEGKIATVDLGRLTAPGQPVRHFAHAATVGLNVNFAKLATRASVREHFGRLTYLVAAVAALQEPPSFTCELHYDGKPVEKLTLTQLSVINAPTFGGALGMRMRDSSPDDRLLDVLAVEDVPLPKVIAAAVFLILHIHREVRGVRALHVQSLEVHTDRPLEVALDGEVLAQIPAEFEVAGEALRVLVPLGFDDIDG